MIHSVEFPGIGESFNRAIYEVLGFYFDGDSGGKAIANHTIEFPDVEIVFDIRRLATPRQKPLVGIFGSLVTNQRKLKCNDQQELEAFATQIRAEVLREVYVSVPKNPENFNENKRQADRIWDMLFAIFHTQTVAFAERNIYTVNFPISGSEEQHENYAILVGNMTCEVRAEYVTRE